MNSARPQLAVAASICLVTTILCGCAAPAREDFPRRNGFVSMHVDADGTVVIAENDCDASCAKSPGYSFDPADGKEATDIALQKAIQSFIDQGSH